MNYTGVRNALTGETPFQGGNTKHQCMYSEFGLREFVDYPLCRHAYDRIGEARGAIDVLNYKAFEENPNVYEGTEEEDKHKTDTAIDKQFKKFAKRTKLWRTFLDCAIRRSVGTYSAMLIQFNDGKDWSEEAYIGENAGKIIKFIPVWQDQLIPSSWDIDTHSITFGEPLEFTYFEFDMYRSQTQVAAPSRGLTVHHSRVVYFGDITGTGAHTILGSSMLRPGMNSLMNIEKVNGAAAEGFYKNAARLLAMSFDAQARLEDLQALVGAKDPTEIKEKLGSVARDANYNFDAMLAFFGAKLEVLGVDIGDPTGTYETNLNSFAASVQLPSKAIVGNQEGSLASQEDNVFVAKRAKSYRENVLDHEIDKIMAAFAKVGLWSGIEWAIEWNNLVDDTLEAKLNAAKIMAEINSLGILQGEPTYSNAEVRTTSGFEPEVEISAEEKRLREEAEKDIPIDEHIDIDA